MTTERSVDVLVAEAVERVAEEIDAWLDTHISEVVAKDALRAAGFPALVEALADIAALDQDVPPPVDDLDSARLNGWQDAARIARAVLGGEVQGRSDTDAERIAQLRAALANLLLYARGNQHVLDLIHGALDEDERLAASTSNDRGDE